jgi:hypothetical protein
MLLVLQEKTKIDKIDFINKNYKIMFNNLINARNSFLKKKNKTILDNTIFQDFFISCMGTTLTQPRLHRLKIEKKKKKGKRFGYMYEPTDSSINKKIDVSYKFANSSGNKILIRKHLKIN